MASRSRVTVPQDREIPTSSVGGVSVSPARESRTIAAVPARKVTVYSLRLTGLTPGHGALLSVCCSRGFYVRTLCRDLGEALGCPAHMRFLLRTRSGPFALDTSLTLEALAEKAAQGTLAGCLLPPEAGIVHMPMAEVPLDLAKAVRNGGHVPWARFAAQGVDAERPFGLRLEGALLGVARRQGEEVKVRTWLAE